MSFDHYFAASLTTRSRLTVDQAIEAIEPFIDYWELSAANVLDEEVGDLVRLVRDPFNAETVKAICFDSSGDVGDGYIDVLISVAKNLSLYCEPARLELVDTDCPNPYEAVYEFWVAGDDELAQTQKNWAVDQAMQRLEQCGFSEQKVQQIREFISALDSDEEAAVTSRPRQR